MEYLSVADARRLPGLRLILTAHMPGPWGEAAKSPIAVLDDESPQSTWLEILLLAQRLGSGPSLIPDDPLERALMMGFSNEICGPDGFGWSRRLELTGRPTMRTPSNDVRYDMQRMTRSYGRYP